MEIFAALLVLCAVSQRPVTGSFDGSFNLCLNKRLNKQSITLSFEYAVVTYLEDSVTRL